MGRKRKDGKAPQDGFNLYKRYDHNPTTLEKRIQGLSIVDQEKDGKVLTKESGVVVSEQDAKFRHIKVHDDLKFVKMYESSCSDLIKLNTQGIAVLAYVLVNVGKMADQITIHPDDFGIWYGKVVGKEIKNDAICYRGVLNLLKHNFIFLRVGLRSYFININKFFNGNRTKIDWVDEINNRLKDGEYVPKSEIKFIGDEWCEIPKT